MLILGKMFEVSFGKTTKKPGDNDAVIIFDPPKNYQVVIGGQTLFE